MGARLSGSEVLRRNEAPRMVVGGGFPEEFVLILLRKNLVLPKYENSLVSTSCQEALASTAAAKQMRRIFGSPGSAARDGVLEAAEADLPSGDERDLAAWLAGRGEKKIKNLARKEESDGKTGRIEGKSDGRALNGFKRRTGERNWCFTCNSESNFAPNCPSQGTLGEGSAPPTPFWNKPPRPPCCSIAMESPISLRNDGFPEKKDTAGIREQSL